MPEPQSNPQTVIILGAGASKDCGFPLGIKLIDQVITAHKEKRYTDSIRRILFNNRIFLRERELFDSLPPQIGEVLTSNRPLDIHNLSENIFTDWVTTLNVFRSIDEFISYHKQYSIFAKISILLILSANEHTSFFENKGLKDEDGNWYTGPERTWYNSLWGNITKNGPTFEKMKEILKTIHIITFNYDRSLDYFLLQAIKKYYPQSEKTILDLPITHVYGSIGHLHPDSRFFNPYKQITYFRDSAIPDEFYMSSYGTIMGENQSDARRENHDKHLLKLALSIDTYGEVYPKHKADAIQNMILQAKRTYIFGFSFAKQNMDILFKPIREGFRGPYSSGTIDGSCYGVPTELLSDLRHFSSRYFHGEHAFLHDERNKTKIADFFTNFSIKI